MHLDAQPWQRGQVGSEDHVAHGPRPRGDARPACCLGLRTRPLPGLHLRGHASLLGREREPLLIYLRALMRTNDVALGEEEPAANPFDARCKDSKHPRELPVGRCSPWTPDTLASSTAADRDPRNPSRGCKAKRDTSDVNVLSFEDSENSSNEDIDVRVSTQGGVSDCRRLTPRVGLKLSSSFVATFCVHGWWSWAAASVGDLGPRGLRAVRCMTVTLPSAPVEPAPRAQGRATGPSTLGVPTCPDACLPTASSRGSGCPLPSAQLGGRFRNHSAPLCRVWCHLPHPAWSCSVWATGSSSHGPGPCCRALCRVQRRGPSWGAGGTRPRPGQRLDALDGLRLTGVVVGGAEAAAQGRRPVGLSLEAHSLAALPTDTWGGAARALWISCWCQTTASAHPNARGDNPLRPT
nr:uncharacterized protein LOC102148365 isoform X2 [Equus caballus]